MGKPLTRAQQFPQAASIVLYPGQVAMLTSVHGWAAEGLLPGSVARCDVDVLGSASSPWAVRESTHVGLWTGHVSHPSIAQYSTADENQRGPGRPQTNWRSTVNNDWLRMGITWEEAEVAALNRSEWRPLGCRLNQDQGQINYSHQVLSLLWDSLPEHLLPMFSINMSGGNMQDEECLTIGQPVVLINRCLVLCTLLLQAANAADTAVCQSVCTMQCTFLAGWEETAWYHTSETYVTKMIHVRYPGGPLFRTSLPSVHPYTTLSTP